MRYPCFDCGGLGRIFDGSPCSCCGGSAAHDVQRYEDLPERCRQARAELAAAGEV